MTLPFAESEGRAFVCFVCSAALPNYDDYKDHILKEHEEGREYVRCPLDRCGAPVRDVRSHFAAKHPTEPVPKHGQMRAVVWRDGRSPNRRKKVRFKEGFYPSKKNGNGHTTKDIHYRSGLEFDLYEILERLDEVVAYESEPFSVDYFYEGKHRKYYPDLMVRFKDGTQAVWEVKPVSQTKLPQNKAKWDSCKIKCAQHNWAFEVVNEAQIARLRTRVFGIVPQPPPSTGT